MSNKRKIPVNNIEFTVEKNDIVLVFVVNKTRPWVCKEVKVENDFAILTLCGKEDKVCKM